ncbi:lytic transglycosylase domain-containing protein [Natranaerobius trueperi]|uniref:Transglycosylase SLT domain-containing protein n=1 Tax=Natranaerobius trueperi TaxID=759412 RepID=A0A226C0V2_9FIRM|nr:lytic transglycosylase domain-containing protein [Natranaerobius trueperi]OWZ84893.1 hypothetical protein CDO51_00355 [Natranaerobius trueperi]
MHTIGGADKLYLLFVIGLILIMAYLLLLEDETVSLFSSEDRTESFEGQLDLYRIRSYLKQQVEQETLTEHDETQTVSRVRKQFSNRKDTEDEVIEDDTNFHIFETPFEQLEPEAKMISEITPLPKEVSEKILDQAKGLELDLALLLGLIKVESHFDPQNVSGAGAIGLMQLMPHTAEALSNNYNFEYYQERLYDPFFNVKLGTKLLRYLIDTYDGDIHKALTAYNRGQGGLSSYMSRNGTAESSFSHWVLEEATVFENKLQKHTH